MPRSSTPQISLRKRPRQARSNELVSVILQAAVQVLAREGAPRFTTARVADGAGVSIGSLYQYFPNKAAILFRLQTDEWQRTAQMLSDVLEDDAHPPLDRLRRLIHQFLWSECEEALYRVALDDAAPLYRETVQARDLRTKATRAFDRFLKDLVPDLSDQDLDRMATVIKTSLSAMGKQVSQGQPKRDEVAAVADVTADMICAYLVSLQSGTGACQVV